jgi:hypothetical protein
VWLDVAHYALDHSGSHANWVKGRKVRTSSRIIRITNKIRSFFI